jgi:2,3-bisphosphoglycerate-independent phosphoglycerate mutase
MRVILIIGDGMADRPIKELGGKTPLQVTSTPSMDEVARTGVNGVMDSIAPGIPPGSDTAHLTILGYDPYKIYEGRGAFEALGAGLKVKPGDVAFRGNFATVDDSLTVLDRRAGRIREGAEELAEALNGLKLDPFPEVQVILKNTVEHRCAVIFRGPHLSRMVSDTDPHESDHKINEAKPLDDSSEALRTSSIVNFFTRNSRMILEKHPMNAERRSKGLLPANAILLRGAGVIPEVRPITDIYGIKALVVAGGALYKGVCNSVGMDSINVPGATGDYATDSEAKAKSAVENLPKYDFILVHIKGTDSASHDSDLGKKIMMIEKVDKLVGHLLKNTDPDEVFIAITSDHTTSTDSGEHTGDPVPVSIKGPNVRVDSVQSYSETDCAQGGLGRIRGSDLMPILMDLVGKSIMFGE